MIIRYEQLDVYAAQALLCKSGRNQILETIKWCYFFNLAFYLNCCADNWSFGLHCIHNRTYLLFAVLSMSLKLPINKGTLGFRTALQKRAAVFNPIHCLILQTFLSVCLICSHRQGNNRERSEKCWFWDRQTGHPALRIQTDSSDHMLSH